jgi:hypothetical protein
MAAERDQEDPVQKWHEVAGVLAAKVCYERFDANFYTALQERHSPLTRERSRGHYFEIANEQAGWTKSRKRLWTVLETTRPAPRAD